MRLLTNVFSKRPKSTSPRLVNSFGKLSLAFLTLDEFFCLSHLINRFLAFCFPIFLRFITYVFVFLCCDLFLLSILLTITAHPLVLVMSVFSLLLLAIPSTDVLGPFLCLRVASGEMSAELIQPLPRKKSTYLH